MGTVLQAWVEKLPWKMQSILFSSLRGPDQALHKNIKQVSKWMRRMSQYNADPNKPYMNAIVLPKPDDLEKELEHCFVHFVHHFADGLAIIAYHHPETAVRAYAARLHYYIAEEMFHFVPEHPETFKLRHRDKIEGNDPFAAEWEGQVKGQWESWFAGVFEDMKPAEKINEDEIAEAVIASGDV